MPTEVARPETPRHPLVRSAGGASCLMITMNFQNTLPLCCTNSFVMKEWKSLSFELLSQRVSRKLAFRAKVCISGEWTDLQRLKSMRLIQRCTSVGSRLGLTSDRPRTGGNRIYVEPGQIYSMPGISSDPIRPI